MRTERRAKISTPHTWLLQANFHCKLLSLLLPYVMADTASIKKKSKRKTERKGKVEFLVHCYKETLEDSDELQYIC